MDSDSDAPLEVSKEAGKKDFIAQRKLETQSQSDTKRKRKRRKRPTPTKEKPEETSKEESNTLDLSLLQTVAKLKNRQEEERKNRDAGISTKKVRTHIIFESKEEEEYVPKARRDNIQIAYFNTKKSGYVYGEVPEDDEDSENEVSDEGGIDSTENLKEETIQDNLEDPQEQTANNFLQEFLNGKRHDRVSLQKLQESGNHRRRHKNKKYRSIVV